MASAQKQKKPKSIGEQVYKASRKGLVSQVSALLDQDPSAVNYVHPTIGNATPLLVAIFNGRLEVVQLLLSRGADPNIRGNDNWSPLGVLILYEQKFLGKAAEVLKLMLDAGADPDQPYKDLNKPATLAQRPIHFALERVPMALVNLLIEYGADNGGEPPYDKAPTRVVRKIARKDKLS